MSHAFCEATQVTVTVTQVKGGNRYNPQLSWLLSAMLLSVEKPFFSESPARFAVLGMVAAILNLVLLYLGWAYVLQGALFAWMHYDYLIFKYCGKDCFDWFEGVKFTTPFPSCHSGPGAARDLL